MRILYYTAEGFGFVPFLFHGKIAQVHVSADMFTIEVLADLFLRLDNEKKPNKPTCPHTSYEEIVLPLAISE